MLKRVEINKGKREHLKSIENDAVVSEGLTNGLTKGLKNVSDQNLVKEH